MVDRPFAVAFDAHAAGAGESGEDVVDDRVAVLASRIVVGDDDPVRSLLGDFRHLRTLASITLSAATEYAPQLTPAHGPESGERVGQGVGRMGVVDHDERIDAATHPLHSARDRPDAVQAIERIAQLVSPKACDRDRGQQVVPVEATEEAGFDRSASPRRGDPKREPRFLARHSASNHMVSFDRGARGVEGQRYRSDARRHPPDQLESELVVAVDHRVGQTRHFEQSRLGARISIHACVVVEVVAAQVGEHRGVDGDPLDSTLVDRVGRHLHGDRVEARIAQVRQSAMDFDRARSGMRDVLQHTGSAGAERSDQGRIDPRSCARPDE